MPVLIKIQENKNPRSMAYGKHFGRVVSTETMSYSQLCKHMSEHNSVYGEDVCLGVAKKLQNCILEQLMEGKKVQFGDLLNIKGLYLRFSPNRQDINDLSSKTLKKRASFMNAKDLVVAKAKKSDSPDPENSGD